MSQTETVRAAGALAHGHRQTVPPSGVPKVAMPVMPKVAMPVVPRPSCPSSDV
jgi:hypothetical protein